MKLQLFVDGASKGNPGPAGIGVLILDEADNPVAEIGESIGITTNNVAEYRALIRGLEEAIHLGCTHLAVKTDSQLLANQVTGKFRINAEHLLVLCQQARVLMTQIPGGVTITHTLRAGNASADKLANQGVRLGS